MGQCGSMAPYHRVLIRPDCVNVDLFIFISLALNSLHKHLIASQMHLIERLKLQAKNPTPQHAYATSFILGQPHAHGSSDNTNHCDFSTRKSLSHKLCMHLRMPALVMDSWLSVGPQVKSLVLLLKLRQVAGQNYSLLTFCNCM
jgi:hypothetical protein